jgi:hypothetical protein
MTIPQGIQVEITIILYHRGGFIEDGYQVAKKNEGRIP